MEEYVAQFWEGPPGSAPAWAQWMVGVSWVLTAGIVLLGLGSARYYLPHSAPLSLAGVVLMTIVGAVAIRRPRPVSRWLRALTVLPLVHLGIMIGAAALFVQVFHRPSPLLQQLYRGATPIALGIVVAAPVVVATAFMRRRGAPAFLRANVYLGAGVLATTGLWAPYAMRFAAPGSAAGLLVVMIPALVTGGLAAWTGRSRNPRKLGRPVLVVGLIVLLGAMISVGLGDEEAAGLRLLAPYVPVLFAEAFYLLVAIGGLALEHQRFLRSVARDRERGAPWCQEGTIVGDGETPVAEVRYDGWLSGVSRTCRAFRLATRNATLDVPAGARLAVPVPPWTSRARPQTTRPVLRAGDRVIVTGFVAPPSEGPLRTQERPIAGSSGLCVSADAAPTPWLDITLLTWRMAALYLGIALLVSLPVLSSL